MKLIDICYLNLNKLQKKNFNKNYPIESSIIRKSIWENISIYCKIKKYLLFMVKLNQKPIIVLNW